MEAREEKKTFFKTRDLAFSASMVESGAKLLRVVNQGGAALFVFEDSVNLRSMVKKYMQGEILVEPKSFLQVWKSLRSQISQVVGKEKP